MNKSTVYEWLTRIHRYSLLIPSRKMLLLRVEKTGQTSYARNITQLKSPIPVMEWRDDPKIWESLFFGQVPIKDRIAIYAVVRNPWDRLVSNWAHMKRENKTELGFEEFVNSRWWESAHYDNWVQHRPCSWWTHQGGQQMADKVLRFEDFGHVAEVLAEAAGVELGVVPHDNGSEHGNYRGYYTDKLANTVAEIYAEDISNFGYQF